MWERSKLYDDNRPKWKKDQATYKAWHAAGGIRHGPLKDFDGATKQELTVAQKKAALQAQIDALG